MKIKKTLLATVLFGCVLSGSAFAEKVTYDKAVADSKAYEESLPHYENATTGLSPAESSSTGGANQMGKWVNVGAIGLQSTGVYATMLTPSALGTSCIKGEKGFVPKKTTTTNKVCISWAQVGNNGGGQYCRQYQTTTTHSYHKNGYKAECR